MLTGAVGGDRWCAWCLTRRGGAVCLVTQVLTTVDKTKPACSGWPRSLINCGLGVGDRAARGDKAVAELWRWEARCEAAFVRGKRFALPPGAACLGLIFITQRAKRPARIRADLSRSPHLP